jgi:hypothetical protein
VPLEAKFPAQAPVAAHDVTFCADQLSVEVPPALTVLGIAVKVNCGTNADTVTVVDCVALPPGPEQVIP